MKEESHLDDMRAALRGDRERQEEARRRTMENVAALIDALPPEEEPEPEPAPKRGRLRGLFGRR